MSREYVEAQKPITQFFIAESIDDRFLGLIGVQLQLTVVGPAAFVSTFYVAGQARGTEVGDLLIRQVEKWAEEHDLTRIFAAMDYRPGVLRAANSRGWRGIGVNLIKDLSRQKGVK